MSEGTQEVAKPEEAGSDFRTLFPGTRISIETAKGKLGWTVFPVGFDKMQRFSKAVGRAVTAITSLRFTPGASFEEQAKLLLPAALPIILEDLLDLVAECCIPDPGFKITLQELPHYASVPLIEAWFEESFGTEEKIRPFVRAVERLVKKISGKSVDLWGTLSTFSSALDIDSKTSSTEGSPDSPTEDGASPK